MVKDRPAAVIFTMQDKWTELLQKWENGEAFKALIYVP